MSADEPGIDSLASGLTLFEIDNLGDPRYDFWLDLYQTSFPLNEQMLVSSLNSALRQKEQGLDVPLRFLACLDEVNNFKGMMLYQHFREVKAAVLWYFAVTQSERCRGSGTAAYGLLHTWLKEEQPNIRALFFEVEDPENGSEPEERRNAERRIAFYRRNGAQQLTGIRYSQCVGWQPRIPMLVMVHAYTELTPEEAFQMGRELFHEDIAQVGTLGLL